MKAKKTTSRGRQQRPIRPLIEKGNEGKEKHKQRSVTKARKSTNRRVQ
jgi:hypothetical protein